MATTESLRVIIHPTWTQKLLHLNLMRWTHDVSVSSVAGAHSNPVALENSTVTVYFNGGPIMIKSQPSLQNRSGGGPERRFTMQGPKWELRLRQSSVCKLLVMPSRVQYRVRIHGERVLTVWSTKSRGRATKVAPCSL